MNIEDVRSEDNYALILSCAYGHIEIVKYLCETFGLSVEDVRSCDNEALMESCNCGHLEIVGS